MDIRFRLLGPAEITVGAETVALPSNKPCIVLATLLLNANSFVSAERLHQTVWGESPPDTARATLQTYVGRLRQLLTRHGVTSCPIRTVPRGYTVEATPDTLDVLRFRELARTARRHAEARDLDDEARCLDDALALWRGPALSNLDFGPLHALELPKLEEERLELVERRVDVELARGGHRSIVSELRSLTATHPQRERFAEQLVEALYRSGRQGEALEETRRVRDVLQRELGVDPGPGLRSLELTILRGEPLLSGPTPNGSTRPVPDPGANSVPARLAVPVGVSCQLPLDTAGFVGRRDTADRVAQDLTGGAGPAVAVLSGAPGVGKTALAVHIAHRVREAFPGGQWYLRLTASDGTPRHPDAVLAELLRTLAVEPTGPAGHTTGLSATFRSAISGRRVLLVLDDVDSVEQVQPLLPGMSGTAVLLTSRKSLIGLTALWGIRSHPLDVLDQDDSVRLLGNLLGPARVAAEPAAARELAELCGRLPLALRIAATKLLHRQNTDLAGFVAWLRADPLGRLTVGADPPVSVRQAFDSSYRRLGDRARRAFGLAGLAATGTVTAEGVASRLGLAEQEAEELLDELFDASLLTCPAPGRFGVPGLLRAYAQERARDLPSEMSLSYRSGSDVGPPREWTS